ncbi:hypothetical protein BDA96_09G030300 [Sorghum bicolor]|uniref:Fe2OG dioxygenase domain-containing protein n=1 Tax=Sorghum bicolor TaxID=4558 RepID=A0A921QA67_SORBI|nr:hypothetical protein BDA96_09G030300 [Sorghum bicolor]
MEGAGAGWPEPVVRVQSLSESGVATIPDCYVKPESERPAAAALTTTTEDGGGIPVVDLSSPSDPATARAVSEACRDWGFFQAVNHGVPAELLRRARGVWRGFFRQPMEVKQRYANSPATYEGYGSRLGVEKGAVLDWGDYYFLHVRPPHLFDPHKWPHLPPDLRETTEEYSREVAALGGRLMTAMSVGLGVGETRLQEAFGGADGAGVCVRVNYYPRCPQPELTLGLSSHSDPGGMTVLLADDRVRGLQVRRRGAWVTVDPVPDAFIVNVGDQIQSPGRAGLNFPKLAYAHVSGQSPAHHAARRRLVCLCLAGRLGFAGISVGWGAEQRRAQRSEERPQHRPSKPNLGRNETC